MLIPITAEQPGGVPEWALVEMQGIIETREGPDGAPTLDIGTMVVPTSKPGVIQLTIGYHQLEGKKVPLKKPVAILDKVAGSDGTRYQVVGVICSKILFKSRPKALISKPAGSKKAA